MGLSGADSSADWSGPSRALGVACPELKHALNLIRRPHVRRRPGGFEGLFRIIVEQQVSVPSAQAILGRINAAIDMSDPTGALGVGVDGLRGLGVSAPKARYVLGLAEQIETGAFELGMIDRLCDDDALQYLMSIKGIGPWSAAIYLLFCAGRIDVWPPKDVALKAAFNHARTEIDQANDALSQAELDTEALHWAPNRGVAAHILWTYYAFIRGRSPI